MMPERTIKGSGGRRGGSVQTDNHFLTKLRSMEKKFERFWTQALVRTVLAGERMPFKEPAAAEKKAKR